MTKDEKITIAKWEKRIKKWEEEKRWEELKQEADDYFDAERRLRSLIAEVDDLPEAFSKPRVALGLTIMYVIADDWHDEGEYLLEASKEDKEFFDGSVEELKRMKGEENNG